MVASYPNPSVNGNNEELFDYANAVDQFNEISDEAEDLEGAFHRYRACAFTMLNVHQNCPENYKAEEISFFISCSSISSFH